MRGEAMMRENTKAETREMWKMYRQGATRKEVAEKYYMTEPNVSWRFKQLGVKINTEIYKNKKVRHRDMRRICDMRRKGMTYEQIAFEYDATPQTIHHAFKRYGIPKIGAQRKNGKDSNRVRGNADNGGGNTNNANCNWGAIII